LIEKEKEEERKRREKAKKLVEDTLKENEVLKQIKL
jgi:hypothetical protein